MPFTRHDLHAAVSAACRALRPGRSVIAAAVAGCALVPAPAALGASAYENPFAGSTPLIGRTDMGVDICLSSGDPIRAVGNGVVVGILRDWYLKQPYIWYELTDGPDAGRYVYVAEQIDQLARVGQTLQAGDVVARFARKGTCIETGWSAATGATLAQATTGYSEGEATAAGVSFAHFLISLGVPGNYQLVVTPKARTAVRHRGTRTRKPAHHVAPKPAQAPTPAPAPTPVSAPVTQEAPGPAPTPATAPSPSTDGNGTTDGSGDPSGWNWNGWGGGGWWQ